MAFESTTTQINRHFNDEDQPQYELKCPCNDKLIVLHNKASNRTK